MESDGQVSRGSGAQVSASMVLESSAKNRRVTIHQARSQDLDSGMIHSASMVLESRAKNRCATIHQARSQDP